jgi:uncharacterized protein
MSDLRPFHLAIPVWDIISTREFYVDKLGCVVGRESKVWIDFNFFGHQLSAHVKPDELAQSGTNPVDGEDVPVRHFGIVLDRDEWHALSEKLTGAGMDFLIKPTLRFKGQAGEQATMFIKDPSGNVIEFKSFRDNATLFAIEDE